MLPTVGFLVTFLYRKYIGRSLSQTIGAMKQLTGSDEDEEVERLDLNALLERSDEISQVGRALEIFLKNYLDKKSLEKERKEASMQAKAQRKTEMKQLANAFKQRVQSVIEYVAEASVSLKNTSEGMTNIAKHSATLTGNTSETVSVVNNKGGFQKSGGSDRSIS